MPLSKAQRVFINVAFAFYFRGREEGMSAADIERLVQRWFVMSVLNGRYTGSIEAAMDRDIRQIESYGLVNYCEDVIKAEVSKIRLMANAY